MRCRTILVLGGLLFACGGGGSGSGDFGLAQRVPVTGLGFPMASPQPGPVRTVNAFPNLSFTNPLFLTHAPGDRTRLFVVEQRGTIEVFANDPATATRKTFLDLRGRTVRTLLAGTRREGRHEVTWDGCDERGLPAASGTYLYRLTTPDEVLGRKLTLVR